MTRVDDRAATGGDASDTLCTMPATELAAAVRSKQVSPVEVTDAVLARINRLNPGLNAFVTLIEDDARRQARQAEQAVMRGQELGALHGVPYALKDATLTKGIRTTFGSKLFAQHVPTEDSLVAERLRAAGGVLIGKTNLPEFGAKCTTDNKVFGATRNPWSPALTPGGSSGGAAAAVAAGMIPLAEGSDHAGSIRCPAALCGVVGLKPSNGRIPIYPDNLLWHAVMWCHGPITRTVADAALMLDVMAGPDDRDPRALCDGVRGFGAAVAARRPLEGRRIGYLRDIGCVPVDPAVTGVCEEALAAFVELGCRIEFDTTDFGDTVEAYGLINASRRAAYVDPYLPDHADDFDPEVVWRAELSRSHTATDLTKAELVQTSAYLRVQRLFQRYDLLVTPTTPTPAFPIEISYPREIAGLAINTVFEHLGLTSLFNLTGHPAISVPAGWTRDGLPVGLQIVGPWRDDTAVLCAAAAYEEAQPWRDRWPPLPGIQD